MYESFHDQFLIEYRAALIKTFVKKCNDGTLDMTHFTEDSMEQVLYIQYCLNCLMQGYDPLE